MYKKVFVTVVFFTNMLFAQGKLLLSSLSEFTEEKKISADCSDAVVKLIKNKKGELFVLKQIADPDPCEQFLLVRDLVACEIGNRCGIPVNKVMMLSDTFVSGLKFYKDRAATIHSFIPGKSLDEELPKFLKKDFILQQKVNSFWKRKDVARIKETDQGLTEDIIKSMSVHKDFCKIVAFDTFIGNADRSLPNIFYDEAKKRFHGIDNAAGFNCRDFAKIAIERLQELEKKGFFKLCDPSVLEGLKIYCKTLELLYAKITPQLVKELLIKYSQYVSCDKQDVLLKSALFLSHAFAKNYVSTKKLIKLLKKIK